MLDLVSVAVMTADTGLYARTIRLPYRITTHGGSFTIETAAERDEMLLTLARSLQAKGVTDYVRIARTADYITSGQLVGTHFTHILSNGERIVHPHSATQTLVRGDDDIWRFTHARYAIANTSVPFEFPKLGPWPDILPSASDRWSSQNA